MREPVHDARKYVHAIVSSSKEMMPLCVKLKLFLTKHAASAGRARLRHLLCTI